MLVGDLILQPCPGRDKATLAPYILCGGVLIEQQPDDASSNMVKLSKVFESGDYVAIGLAKSLLDEAEIPYSVKNEGLQDLFTIGRIGTGYNPLVGPIQIWVHPQDEDRALELLAQLEGDSPTGET